jgi:hypothetical protein
VLTIDQLGISEEDWTQTPASVRTALMFLLQYNQRLENRCATYELQVQKLGAELERLKKLELEVAELRERLGRNSQNSSKSPSSDPPSVSRPNNRQPSGRQRGGQVGHQGRTRKLLPLEEVKTVIELRPTTCRQCGCLLLGDDPDPVGHQVSEIPPVKAEVTEYHQRGDAEGKFRTACTGHRRLPHWQAGAEPSRCGGSHGDLARLDSGARECLDPSAAGFKGIGATGQDSAAVCASTAGQSSG